MPTIKHNIIPVDPIGLEEFSNDDIKVVESFDVNTTFDAFQHKIELHVYTEDNQLIDSYYDYRNEKFLQGSQTAGTTGASELTLDPKEDAERLGYTYGGINFVYNFLDNLYSETGKGGEFFIEEISEDRTEIRLLTNQIEEDAVIRYTNKVKEDLDSTSYFNEFRLNVKNNDLLIGINIDIQDYREYKSVIVKLYEPLPQEYDLKQLLTIERIISDTVAFKVNTVITPDEIKVPYLKGPNFNIEEAEEQNSPTGFLNYNDLFSFPTNNTYREVHSRLNEKGVDISVHYNDFANFTQFSSIEERIRNFQYKLNLIETYQSQSDVIDSIEGPATGSRFLTGSSVYYTNKINTILDNFDHYDRHLYYESGSTSWPKQNNSKPYIQATGSATGSFFTEIILSASSFDQSNESQLLNSIPEYLREDPDSVNYNTFINMLAQHFDNIWVYAKALSDKYDNDNRLEYGISKDLVQDTLRNFGVKVYNNFRSTEDLFRTFTGELYASESIHQTVVSASNNVISLENYRKDISKRIYHNLPYLLKTKGTERGIKALITSFGVPTNSNLDITNSDTISIPGLYVRTIGGNFTSGSLNFGPSFESTSSIAKIKVDNTGSIVASGSTLSYYTSIVQRDKKYSDDLHTVEVGYSPSYELNKNIISRSGNFNIDNIIGDPRIAYSSSYESLVSQSNLIINETTSHHYGEFVRSLKFYDNVLFKMIKDFVPARSNINTGIIIKPHLLERNKLKQVQLSQSFHYYSSSTETNDTTGSSGGSYTDLLGNELTSALTASYTESIITPLGATTISYHLKERARYDGELSGSYIQLVETDGDLNDDNTWKYKSDTTVSYKGELVELITCPVIGTLTAEVSKLLIFTGSFNFENNDAGQYGFVYSTNTSPDIGDTRDNVGTGGGTGIVTSNTLVVPSVGTYYVRGFISQSGACGVAYSNEVSVTFSCPTITNPTTGSSITTTGSIPVTASVSDAGTGTLISRGFIYSTASNGVSSISTSQYIISASDVASVYDPASTGTYSVLLSGSGIITGSEDYYIRSFASSSICTVYGSTTLVVDVPSTLMSQSFGGSEISRASIVCNPPGEQNLSLDDTEATYWFYHTDVPAPPYPPTGSQVYVEDPGVPDVGDPAIAFGSNKYIMIAAFVNDNGESHGTQDNYIIEVDQFGYVVQYLNCNDL